MVIEDLNSGSPDCTRSWFPAKRRLLGPKNNQLIIACWLLCLAQAKVNIRRVRPLILLIFLCFSFDWAAVTSEEAVLSCINFMRYSFVRNSWCWKETLIPLVLFMHLAYVCDCRCGDNDQDYQYRAMLWGDQKIVVVTHTPSARGFPRGNWFGFGSSWFPVRL